METFSASLALCAVNSPVPVNSPHKGQWRGALMFSLIYVWINDWVNNRDAGELRRHRGHYDVIVMKIANKIAKCIGVMSGLKYQLDKTTLVLIYNSLVLPHFYFSILAWGFESERLLKLQKKAIRTIHRAKYNAHTKPLNEGIQSSRSERYFWHTMCKILLQIQARYPSLIFWKVLCSKQSNSQSFYTK